MTAEYVAYHAADRPDAIAVVTGGRAIGYAELDRDIRALSWAVRRLGLARGQSIALRIDDLYLHWCLLLACERLGIAASSFIGSGDRELLDSVDVVLAEPPVPPIATRQHAITADWLDAALRGRETEIPPAPLPDDPVRIVSTSGTTGSAKRFRLSRRAQDARVAQFAASFNISRASRYLVTLPITMRGTFDCGSACLRAGGTIVLEPRKAIAEVLRAHELTHLLVLPMQLTMILADLPPDFSKPRDLSIISFGGRVSPELRARIAERLTASLCETYGASEVCTISTIWRPDPDGFGMIPPRVEVEVLDDRGDPVPMGSVGQIRIRNEVMCEGYIGDAEATARMFSDGWFYPGDLAILQPGRRVKVLGRSDDIINIGGQKYSPELLEQLLLRCRVAADVGVCLAETTDGIGRLCVAIARPECQGAALQERAAAALEGHKFGVFLIVEFAEIPRNANGKIERARLKAAVISSLREAAKPAPPVTPA